MFKVPNNAAKLLKNGFAIQLKRWTRDLIDFSQNSPTQITNIAVLPRSPPPLPLQKPSASRRNPLFPRRQPGVRQLRPSPGGDRRDIARRAPQQRVRGDTIQPLHVQPGLPDRAGARQEGRRETDRLQAEGPAGGAREDRRDHEQERFARLGQVHPGRLPRGDLQERADDRDPVRFVLQEQGREEERQAGVQEGRADATLRPIASKVLGVW